MQTQDSAPAPEGKGDETVLAAAHPAPAALEAAGNGAEGRAGEPDPGAEGGGTPAADITTLLAPGQALVRQLRTAQGQTDALVDNILDQTFDVRCALKADRQLEAAYLDAQRARRRAKGKRGFYDAVARRDISVVLVQDTFDDVHQPRQSEYAAALWTAAEHLVGPAEPADDTGEAAGSHRYRFKLPVEGREGECEERDMRPSEFIARFAFKKPKATKPLQGLKACAAYRTERNGRSKRGDGDAGPEDPLTYAQERLAAGARCVGVLDRPYRRRGPGFREAITYEDDSGRLTVCDYLDRDAAHVRTSVKNLIRGDRFGNFAQDGKFRPLVEAIAAGGSLLPDTLDNLADPDKPWRRTVQFQQVQHPGGGARLRLAVGYAAATAPWALIDADPIERLPVDLPLELTLAQQQHFFGCFPGRDWHFGGVPGPGGCYALFGHGNGGVATVGLAAAVPGHVLFPPALPGVFEGRAEVETWRLLQAVTKLRAGAAVIATLAGEPDGTMTLASSSTPEERHPIGTGQGIGPVESIRVDLLGNFAEVADHHNVAAFDALVSVWGRDDELVPDARLVLLVASLGGRELSLGIPPNPHGVGFWGPEFAPFRWDFAHAEVTAAVARQAARQRAGAPPEAAEPGGPQSAAEATVEEE